MGMGVVVVMLVGNFPGTMKSLLSGRINLFTQCKNARMQECKTATRRILCDIVITVMCRVNLSLENKQTPNSKTHTSATACSPCSHVDVNVGGTQAYPLVLASIGTDACQYVLALILRKMKMRIVWYGMRNGIPAINGRHPTLAPSSSSSGFSSSSCSFST